MTYVNLAENARAGKAAFVGSLAARDSKRMKLQEMSFLTSPLARRYSLDTSVGASIWVDSELNGRGGRYVNRGSDRLDHGLCGITS